MLTGQAQYNVWREEGKEADGMQVTENKKYRTGEETSPSSSQLYPGPVMF